MASENKWRSQDDDGDEEEEDEVDTTVYLPPSNLA